MSGYIPLNVISLATGTGGLEIGLKRASGRQINLLAVADPDKSAAAVLAQRFPGVPNLGDVREIDWLPLKAQVVDVLTAGFPCQPFSHAGNRLAEEDPRHIWPDILKGIETLLPGHVLIENVIGFRKLGLPTVIADLEALGYQTNWSVFTASDAGMPHQRKRVYLLASRLNSRGLLIRRGCDEVMPAPLAPKSLVPADELLPTATPFTLANRENPDEWQARWRDVFDRTGTRHGLPLSVALRALAEERPINQSDKGGPRRWSRYGGVYETAITHWSQTCYSMPPKPLVVPNPKREGDTLVNPAYPEWMMSLPAGHVSEVEGITIQNKLKLIGNAVAPDQAVLALGQLVSEKDRA